MIDPCRSMHRWDIFARVVDNFGDAGVSWRLARQLVAEHGLDVTLWIDRLGALSRIAPGVRADVDVQRVSSVTVRHWSEPLGAAVPADVVVEAFGCGLPHAYVAAMVDALPRPQWFVLEYLSAEAWVAGAHALPSPHPRLPLDRRFWFPGFTAHTGGLLREHDLFAARDAFRSNRDAQSAWWTSLGVPMPSTNETRISLFCYPNRELPALFDAWSHSDAPIVCVVPEDVASAELEAWEGRLPRVGGPASKRGNLALHTIPFVGQDDYDKILWTCDVNFVRGEDSFVRAQWAARPFVWHLYPQTDDAHLTKLGAFIDLYTAKMEPRAAAAIRRLSEAWNGGADAYPIGSVWGDFAAARSELTAYGGRWAAELTRVPDFAGSLVKAAKAGYD